MKRTAFLWGALLAVVLPSCGQPTMPGKIAFSSDRDGNPEIYSMNADGSGLERLTYGPQYDTNPVWSQDGQHIAFNCEIQGNLDVCVMHADGSPAINLTDSPGADGSPSAFGAPGGMSKSAPRGCLFRSSSGCWCSSLHNPTSGCAATRTTPGRSSRGTRASFS